MRDPRTGNRTGVAPRDAEVVPWLEGAEVASETEDRPADRGVEVRVSRDLAARPRVEIPTIRDRTEERARGRVLVLRAIAGLLLVCNLVAWGVHLGRPTDPLATDATAIPYTPILHETVSIGPVLYVETSPAVWGTLSETQRAVRVRELGLGAGEAGYGAVFVVGANGEELAFWSAERGTTIRDRTPRD